MASTVDFPRGGAQQLTPLEYRAVLDKATKDSFLMEDAEKKPLKRRKTVTKKEAPVKKIKTETIKIVDVLSLKVTHMFNL